MPPVKQLVKDHRGTIIVMSIGVAGLAVLAYWRWWSVPGAPGSSSASSDAQPPPEGENSSYQPGIIQSWILDLPANEDLERQLQHAEQLTDLLSNLTFHPPSSSGCSSVVFTPSSSSRAQSAASPIMAPNLLLSAQKSTDGLQVALHPLVILTVSDYIIRHQLRGYKTPIVGGLLGQQNGREITIEHAFDILTLEVDGETRLEHDWFENRLQQMKDVHKVPALELVGWYTLMPTSGPQSIHLPIHKNILETYNDSAILLGFHTEEVLKGQVGGKLPLTIYESNFENDTSANDDAGDGDKVMKDGNEVHMTLKFKELPYNVETGEAEMISVDFVARGGGNASAVDATAKPVEEEKSKGKKVLRSDTAKKTDSAKSDENALTSAEEELIASLTAKTNAIKMLKSRIDLIIAYLQALPPTGEDVKDADATYTEPNQQILRAILALLQRLILLVPANSRGFSEEILSEENDVGVVSLLSTMTTSIQHLREAGKKFKVVEDSRQAKDKNTNRSGGMGWDGGSQGQHNIMGVGDIMN